MKSFEEYIREAVYFRLGGKGDKGEDLYKTFRELEEGDKIYLYKFHDFNIKSMSSYVYMFDSLSIKDADYDLIRGRLKTSANAQNINILKSDVDKEYFVCFFEYKIRRWKHISSYVYSTHEMTEEEVLEVANKAWEMKDKSFKQYIEESVDFRLGGSKNKGAADKTFDELEAGDTYYIWKCEFNFKLVYKDERNVKTVTRDETANVIHFESMGEGKSMNRFERKYADDDTMLIMSGTLFYFYATHDMTDEEVVKKIKEKRDSKNYKTW